MNPANQGGHSSTESPKSNHAGVQTVARIQPDSYMRRASFNLGNIDIIKSLQHSERDIFYSTVWEDHCLPAMHPIFQALSTKLFDHSILSDATLALSSCSFSRLQPEQKVSVTSAMGSLSPHLIHQTRSQLYYSSAIQRFASLSEMELYSNPTAILTVLVIFAHIECSMGNFQGFYCHDQGITTLSSQLGIGLKVELEALLASWIQVRLVIWWARIHFCSSEVQLHFPPDLPSGISMEEFNPVHGRRVTVLSIMCKSHHLNFSALLRYWDTGVLGSNSNAQDVSLASEYIESVFHALAEQGRKLDKWVESLPIHELPIGWPNGGQEIHDINLQTPIFFRSHEAALNFAYYTVGRIMQCKGLLHSLAELGTPHSYNFQDEEAWASVLLRIAKGTDMVTSLSMNSYTIGFSGLLLSALLRCQSQAIAIEIQNWLQGLEALKPTEEGAFPLYQSLRVVNIINRQKRAGRDVLAVTMSVDDEGGSPKINSYSSQAILGLLFHGIVRESGDLFTDYLTMDP